MSSLESALSASLNDHNMQAVALAFRGGVMSSGLPCMMSLLPMMVGTMGAFGGKIRRQVLRHGGCFVVGLALAMTGFGLAASLLGTTYGGLIASGVFYAVGMFAFLLSLQLLGVFQFPLPLFLYRMRGLFLLGVLFGCVLSPCGTPFLAVLLAFIPKAGSLVLGGLSLFSYALGQTAVLLGIGLFTGALGLMAQKRGVSQMFTRLSGGVFLLVALMLLATGANVLVPVLRFCHLF